MKEVDEAYMNRLLTGWEDVHKKGQLTLWVLLALKDGPKHMAEIKEFITDSTNGTLAVDDNSLYRALRRYYDTEMTKYVTAPGNGPDRKIYELSPIGREVLDRFVRRNIIDLFYKPEIQLLLRGGEK